MVIGFKYMLAINKFTITKLFIPYTLVITMQLIK